MCYIWGQAVGSQSLAVLYALEAYNGTVSEFLLTIEFRLIGGHLHNPWIYWMMEYGRNNFIWNAIHIISITPFKVTLRITCSIVSSIHNLLNLIVKLNVLIILSKITLTSNFKLTKNISYITLHFTNLQFTCIHNTFIVDFNKRIDLIQNG